MDSIASAAYFNNGCTEGRFAVWHAPALGYISAMRKKGFRLPWILLALAAVLAVGIFVTASVWIRGFLHSDQFRLLVSAKTGEAFRSTATYSPLRWAGPSVFADSLQVGGNPGSIVQNLRADQIRAEVNWRAIREGAWRVDRIDVVSFEGTFRPGSPDGEKTDFRENAPPASWLAAFLPKRFELGQLNIGQARIDFQGRDGREIAALKNSALLVRPDGAGWAIDGNGGSLTMPSRPTMAITSFRSRIQDPTFFLTEATLRLGEAGKITASGEFAADSKLQAEWTQIDIANFLDTAWTPRLSGLFAGTAVVEWPEAGLSARKATGTFRLTDGLLQNLQALDQIATFTGAPQFRRMPLQEISGTYQWAGGVLALTNLVAESKGLMRIEGNCGLAADGVLSGTVRVGVAPQTLQWLPGSRERVFTVAQNGYLWTDVRVGGTLHNPKEDLSARLVAAMKNEVIQQGEKIIEVLPGGAKEGTKGLLDLLKPLLP